MGGASRIKDALREEEEETRMMDGWNRSSIGREPRDNVAPKSRSRTAGGNKEGRKEREKERVGEEEEENGIKVESKRKRELGVERQV